MILALNVFALLEAQYANLKAQVIELDRWLALRYGDRYIDIRQQWGGAKAWYDETKAEAESSGTVPLDQQQEATRRQLAEAGSAAARKEGAVKQQLKELWHTLTHG